MRPGERWRIYGQRFPDGMVETSVCAGSERLAHATRPTAATSPASDVVTDQGPAWPLIALTAALLAALVGLAARRLQTGRR